MTLAVSAVWNSRALWLAGAVGILGIGLTFLLMGGEGSAVPGPKGVFHRGNGNEPDTLDPHKATGSWESNIIGELFVGLTTDDVRGRPIPGAAESWAVSEDGLTYTFRLRDHLWSDGTPVTAHDFAFGIRHLLDPKQAAQYASLAYVVKGANAVNRGVAGPETLGARAIDDRTFELTLEHPAPYLPELLSHYAMFAVPRHVVERYGIEWVRPGNMVGNGPYTLAEWVANDHIRLVRNPHFYDAGNVAMDEVWFYPTDDAVAGLKRFRAGDLDVNVNFPSQQLDWLRETLPQAIRIAPYLNTRYVIMNTRRPPFDDTRVRRAISLAIDREMITEKILRAGDLPAYELVPPGISNYPATAALRFRGGEMETRRAEARRLLAEAGYDGANPLRVTYNFIQETDSRRMAVALQDMWTQIGVEVEAHGQEKKVHFNQIRLRDFDMGEGNWIADYDDAGTYLFLLLSTSGQMNSTGYNNPEFDRLVAAADRKRDPAARGRLLAQAEQVMLDDSPLAPIFHGVSRALVHGYVKGWEDNISNVHRTRWIRLERRSAAADS